MGNEDHQCNHIENEEEIFMPYDIGLMGVNGATLAV
jgi:hypothetical protein